MSNVTRSDSPSDLPYRPCVGIMLINSRGLIWAGCRRDPVAERGKNWQMPQGGIDDKEEPASAALRELAEETGTGKAEILAETRNWLYYDLPPKLVGIALKGKYRGQKQKWFAMRFLGSDADFNIHSPSGGHSPEFEAWRWTSAEELLTAIVPFKRKVYEAVISEFKPFLK